MPNTLLDQFNNPNPGPGTDQLAPYFGYQNLPGNNPNFPAGGPGGYNLPTSVQQLPPGALPVNAIPNPTNINDLGTLTEQINQMNRAGQTAALNARIPGAAGLEQQSSNLIGQELAGQVPLDVQQMLQNQGAERATLSGGNASAAYLRALGLTSIDQTQRGEQNLTAADARNPAAPIFDPSTMLLTPAQRGQLALGQGNLTLSQQEAIDRSNAENNRLRLEAQRLALSEAGGGGGGGRTGGVGGGGAGGGPGGYNPITFGGQVAGGVPAPVGGVAGYNPMAPVTAPGGGVYTGGAAGGDFFNQLQTLMNEGGAVADQGAGIPNDWGIPNFGAPGSMDEATGQNLWDLAGQDTGGSPSNVGAFDTAQAGSPELDLNQWLIDQNPELFGVDTGGGEGG